MTSRRPPPTLALAAILGAAAAWAAFLPVLGAGGGPDPALAPGLGSGRDLRAYRPDLNRSPPHRLQLVPGLGPVRALAVVAERRRSGPFRSFEDIGHRIRGIGPATVASARRFADLEVGPGPRPATVVRSTVGGDQPEHLE